ncbi:MAG: uncharacterized protein KVP18_000745, partial [Porospora cf. gigantea A]|uniref:uncharacterized protein n=1 Tax=Porospora cf. gigantea A TaxID=2853593 RepID=UPI0035593D49
MNHSFLRMLEVLVGEAVFYAEFITVHFEGATRRLFLVMGQHFLHFLRRDGFNVVPRSQLPYASIGRVTTFALHKRIIVLELDNSRPEAYSSVDSLSLRCLSGPQLLQQLHIACSTDSLIRRGTLTPPEMVVMRYERPSVPPSMETPAHTAPEPFYKTLSFSVADLYSVWLFDDYRIVAKGMFRSPRGCEITVTPLLPESLEALEFESRLEIQHLAIDVESRFYALFPGANTLISNLHPKKMNFGGAIEQWTSWELILQTPEWNLFIGIVRHLRVPPFMDQVRDVIIVLKMAELARVRSRTSWHKLRAEMHLAVDSLQPYVVHDTWYKSVIECWADCLALPCQLAMFTPAPLRTKPFWHASAKGFVLALVHFFKVEKVLDGADYIILKLGGTTETPNSPAVALNAIVKNPPGLPTEVDTPSLLQQRNVWSYKVAQYLATFIDEGPTAPEFTLCDVFEAFIKLEGRAREAVEQVLSFLLHYRSPDFSKPWDKSLDALGLLMKPALPPKLDGAFGICVGRVILRLFSSRDVYPEFPLEICGKFVLPSSHLPAALKADMLRAIGSLGSTLTDWTVSKVLPEVLRLTTDFQAGEEVQKAATACLVNITATRANLRRALLGSPVEAIVSSQLRRGGRNLKAVAAKLALNLSTRVGHKARLIEAGLHNVIVDLFAQSIPQILMTDTARMQITFDAEVSSEQKDEEANVMADMVAKNLDLLVDCAGVIGQLSVDDSVAIKIHDRFPVLDFLLVLVSMARPHSVHMAKLLFAVSKFVKLSWRNQQRAAFHLMNKILWLCQVPPSLASGSDPTLW